MSEPKTLRVAMVTGASGGLGAALVQALRNHHWHVAAVSHSASAHTAGDDLLDLSADVSQKAQVTAVVEQTLQRWGRIDALINNAGVTADELLLKLSEADWDRVLQVNLKGAFLFTQAVARTMTRQREGHIVNISSYVARVGRAGQTAYAAAKAGLIGLTQSTAKELGSRNVRANAILPGLLATPMTVKLSPEQLESLAAENVLGRINSTAEVARFVAWLLETSNISGQVFQLDSRVSRWC